MSEPLSAVEIEDVLSSIRRLVSEDHRPAPRVRAGGVQLSAAAVPSEVDDKLILMPSFRVARVPVPMPVSGLLPPDRPATETVPMAHPAVAGPATQAAGPEPGQVVALRDATTPSQEWESETGDPAPDGLAGMNPAIWDPAIWDSVEPTVVAEAEVLADRPASDDAAESWAQDASAESSVCQPMSEAPPPLPVHADPVWADAVEAEVIAGLADADREAAPDPAPMSGLLDDLPEMTFDEEVLRDLVRDLIREELQGNLGERITRNIRKLVRAEIARAMAAREFD